MSAIPGPSNPIFYAQYHARGGTRNTAIVCGVYAVAIAGLIWATTDFTNARRTADALQGWLIGLLVLQILALLMYGSLRVSGAVRSDVTAKLLESHRLMPLPPMAAIVGYILGPPIQALAVAGVNVVLGILICPTAGIAEGNWLLANGMILAFALMIWTITAQVAFASRAGFALIAIGVALSMFVGGQALDLVPGLGVITAPLIGRSVLDLRSVATAAAGDSAFCYGAALVAQGVLAALFFCAAARKYRSSETPGFNVSLGLLLLAAVVAISAEGILYHDSFMPYWRRMNSGSDDQARFVASVVLAMLLMIPPIAAAAAARSQFARLGPTPDRRRRPVATALVCLAAVILTCVLLRVHPTHFAAASGPPSPPVVRRLANGRTMYYYTGAAMVAPLMAASAQSIASIQTGAIVLAFGAAVAMLLVWANRRRWRGWVVLIIWLVIVGIVPLIADTVQRSTSTDNTHANDFGVLATLSPVGDLSVAWEGQARLASIGLAFQWAILLLPIGLLLTTGRRQLPTAAPATAAPADQGIST